MRSAQADRVAAGAREDAATYTPAEMLEQFSVTGPRAIATARQLGSVVVDYFGRAMLPLDEAEVLARRLPPVDFIECHRPARDRALPVLH